MWPTFLTMLSLMPCATGSVSPPVPFWKPTYSNNLGSIPNNGTTFITGDLSTLVVVLKHEDGSKFTKTVALNKKVKPRVNVAITRSERDTQYIYTVANEATAVDPISTFWTVVPADFDSPVATTEGVIGGKQWNGGISLAVIARQCEIPEGPIGRYAHWINVNMQYAITPGTRRAGFGLKTSFRPGFTTSYIGGPLPAVPEDWEDVDERILIDPVWTRVHLPLIGPVFNEKASCSEILSNYRYGLRRLLERNLAETDKKAGSTLLAFLENAPSDCQIVLNKIRSEALPVAPEIRDISSALQVSLERKQEHMQEGEK